MEKKVIKINKVLDHKTYTEVPTDPIESLEQLYIDTYKKLPFTSHKELEEYMSNFEENSRYKREKLKSLREEKYITIPDMAQLLGISKDGYFKIESGAIYPRLPLAFKIAKLLQTTVDELFGI